MQQNQRLLYGQVAAILVVCFFVFFFGLGAFGLTGADEPRYAQIAREMLAHHDWITPVLNGKPWLEKPVLLYWKMMNSYAVFGVHDWAARIPSAAYATMLVLVVFFFMRRFRPATELDAALITATCVGVIGFARGASTDMVLSAPLCMAMLAWWAWHETQRKLWLAWFFALLGVSALAKGPVAPALALLIVAAYAILRRDGNVLLRSVWWPGFLLFFAIALPWYVAVQIKVPEFFKTFFIQHNLERFGTNLYQHHQPFWFYFPVSLLGVLPWTVFTVSAVVEAVRAAIHEWKSEDPCKENSEWLPVYLLLWIAIPIIFFSISQSKLPGYILPSVPAAAVLTADYLYRRETVFTHWRVLLHALICGAMAGGALLAPWRMLRVHLSQTAGFSVAAAALLMTGTVLVIVRRLGGRGLRLATLLPIALALGFLLGPAAHVLDMVTSSRAVDAELNKDGAPAGPIAVFNVKREVEYGLNFYRNQPISRYERDGIPGTQHVVIAKEGSGDAVAALAGDRQVRRLGAFPPQHLEFFLVSNAK